MVPRRVLLRIKKLRRFLDERIREALRRREAADDDAALAEAETRLSAFQEVRDEMVGERLDPEEVDLGGEEEAEGPEAVEDGADDPEEADDAEAPEETEEAPSAG